MKKISILGATGSIGLSTLHVVEQHLSQYEIFALTAHRQAEKLFELCLKYHPKFAVMTDALQANKFQDLLNNSKLSTKLLIGPEALCEVASHPDVDIIMAAIVGAAGLSSTLAALESGKRVLLANKEALIMAGNLVMRKIKDCKASLLPVDSEHNAIFQCLPENYHFGRLFPGSQYSTVDQSGVTKIILTASGGAFRNLPLKDLAYVTPEQACQHPNWSMGKKITVDSATMMNKALEIIEAHYLFGLPAHQIDVMLHPQSIIHSMVCFNDGSTLAQLGMPDMRTPIANVLAWPERIKTSVPQLDLTQVGRLDFASMDDNRFPCLQLAYEALKQAGTAATFLNAANEVSVEAFLNNKIGYLDIYRINENVLSRCSSDNLTDLKDILVADATARAYAKEQVSSAMSTHAN